MSELLVVEADGSGHPLVVAAEATGRAVRRIGAADAGWGSVDLADVGALIVVDPQSVEPVAALIETVAADRPVIVAPDPGLLRALGERLTDESAGRVIVACMARFEPAAAAIAGSVAGGSLGLPWGIHVEVLGDPRPPAEAATDLADLAVWVTASALRGAERLGDGSDPLVVIPELEHGLVASITVVPPGTGGTTSAAPSTLLRIDASHGQASADLLSPMLRTADRARRFGPTGPQLLLDAALTGSVPADLRLSAVLGRLAPLITALL